MSTPNSNPQSSATGLKSWLTANNVETISAVDEIYRYDRKQQQDMLAAKPWDKEYNQTYLNVCKFFF